MVGKEFEGLNLQSSSNFLKMESDRYNSSNGFIIKLHIKDFKILEKIKNTLEVRNIRKNGKDSVEYRVYSIKELQVIINHFNKYPLITNKLSDYLIFNKCFELIKNREHLNEKGLLKIINLKSSLNWGLLDKLKSNFPNIIPIQHAKKEFIFKGIPNSFWVSEFTSRDGFFHIVTRKTNSKVVMFTQFSIHLHIRELEIIKELSKIFKLYKTKITGKATVMVENYNYYILNKSVILQITKNSNIVNTIILFFEKFPISGIKSLDFAYFKEVANMIKNKEHLTNKGYNKILEIKLNMNQKRS